MKYYGFIYITTCLVNKMKYIGKKSYNSKFGGDWKTYLGSSKWLKQDIEKYGKNNFKREIIEKCLTKQELNQREIYYQKLWNVKIDKTWYNLHIQSENFDTTGLRFQYSEKRKQAIWTRKRRLLKSIEMKKKNLNYLPGVSKARSIRLKTGKQRNPFKEPAIIQKIRLQKMKPVLLQSPEGLLIVFATSNEVATTLHVDISFLRRVKEIKQGKSKGWKWINYVQL